jgi:predicted GNAT superfamily acetyltransferase
MSQQIEIRQLSSMEELVDLSTFFRDIWQGDDDVVPADLAAAVVHAGGYASASYQDGAIVAGSFGFRGDYQGQPTLHSHVTASSIPGAGFDLKQHQRDWALSRGIELITWTFDPLVRRNCVFNFVKLGAVAVEYLPNFYGIMTDSINAGDESDRLLALWSLRGQQTESSELFQVELPEDIESLRKSDLASALQWRASVREKLVPAIGAGAKVTGMTHDRTRLIVSK